MVYNHPEVDRQPAEFSTEDGLCEIRHSLAAKQRADLFVRLLSSTLNKPVPSPLLSNYSLYRYILALFKEDSPSLLRNQQECHLQAKLTLFMFPRIAAL